MKSINKIITRTILILTFIVLFSTLVNAIAVSDGFRNGLLSVNNFFSGQQFQPYAQAIDFFFFSLFFIALYMMGARYAFKEMKRPEQVIVILLGLMTAFLLVLAGWSATVLLPYIHWIFYILLFALWYWLLKGIKSKFWRFILALLLTLLTIYLLSLLLSGFVAPDASGYISPFFESLKGISFPELPGPPGIPSGISDLFGPPSAPPPTGPSTLPPTPTPDEGGGFFGFLKDWWWLPLLLFALIYGIYRFRRRGGRRPPTNFDPILNSINNIITRKQNAMGRIRNAFLRKIHLLTNILRLQQYLTDMYNRDHALLWTDRGRNRLRRDRALQIDIYEEEFNLIDGLRQLREVEIEIWQSMPRWLQFIQRVNTATGSTINITPIVDALRHLISDRIAFTPGDIHSVLNNLNGVGIIYLLEFCYDFELRERTLSKDFDRLLREENIESFVRGKFSTIGTQQHIFNTYMTYESQVINELEDKIRRQIDALNQIITALSGTTPTATTGTVTFIVNEAGTNRTTGSINVEGTRAGGGNYPVQSVALNTPIPNFAAGDWTFTWLPTNLGHAPTNTPLTVTVAAGANVDAVFTIGGGGATGGTIRIEATHNGTAYNGPLQVQVLRFGAAPTTHNLAALPADISGLADGLYRVLHAGGGPTGATLTGINPNTAQGVTAGSTVTFTFEFTGGGPSGGTIKIESTHNGAAYNGPLQVQVLRFGAAPTTHNLAALPADISGLADGLYRVLHAGGGPTGATLTGINPNTAQGVTAGGTPPVFVFTFTSGGGAPRVEIKIAATLDGHPVPTPFMMRFRVIRGRWPIELDKNIPFTFPPLRPGQYTFEYVSGAPPGATFRDITPSGPQNLVPSPTPYTFTFNFLTGGSSTGDSVTIKAKVNGVDWPVAGRTGNMSIRVASPTGVIAVHRVPHAIRPATDGDYHVEWLTGRGAGGPTAARFIGINPQTQRKVAGRDLEFVFEFARGRSPPPPPGGTKKRRTSGTSVSTGNISNSQVTINSPNAKNTNNTNIQEFVKILKMFVSTKSTNSAKINKNSTFAKKAWAIFSKLTPQQRILGKEILELCTLLKADRFKSVEKKIDEMFSAGLLNDRQMGYLLNIPYMLQVNQAKEALKLMNSAVFNTKPFDILREFLKNY